MKKRCNICLLSAAFLLFALQASAYADETSESDESAAGDNVLSGGGGYSDAATADVSSPRRNIRRRMQEFSDRSSSGEKGKQIYIASSLGEPVYLNISGHYRLTGYSIRQPNLDVSVSPHSIQYINHFLKVSPSLDFGNSTTLHSRFVAFNGDVLGDDDKPYAALAPGRESAESSDFILSRLYISTLTPVGVIQFGRMPSQWGIGLVANDGDTIQPAFGINAEGDTADRIFFATKPFGEESNLIAAYAFGKVVENNLTGRPDDLFEHIGAVLNDAKSLKLGAYVVYRLQASTNTKVLISDFYARMRFSDFFGESEFAMFRGKTSFLSSADNQKAVDVKSSGLVVRVGMEEDLHIEFLEFGYASGDGNLFDGEMTQFYFNKEYNVGMIMFEYALAKITNDIVENDIRPNSGTLPAAAEVYATNGSLTNAIYIKPYFKIMWLPQLHLKFQLLVASALQDFQNPYLTQIGAGGGESVGLRGASASHRDYGYEVDMGADLVLGGGNFVFGFEGGYFWPGAIFNTIDSTTGEEKRPDNVSEIVTKLSYKF